MNGSTVDDKKQRMRQVLQLQRPDRLPMGDMAHIEYRPDVYHLGEPEFTVKQGEVGISRDGSKKFTQDGGVWAVGDANVYQDFEDVLSVDLAKFPVEQVNEQMLAVMRELYQNKSLTNFPIPLHYGTLITRATIEFGWEPFLMAFAYDEQRVAGILERFARASLAVVGGWAALAETELITVHDDIAGTKGVFIKPDWYRKYVFPWYQRMFAAVQEKGKKVLYLSDGNYLDVLDDILELNPDGLYVESSSLSPVDLLPRAGKDKIFLIKTDSRNIDHGTPEDIHEELSMLRQFHQDYPGMYMYPGGGNPKPGNLEAFERYYQELLVYA